MKRKRFSEEQIIGVLKESEAGMPTPELCRKHGISEGTFYRWKSKYGGDFGGPEFFFGNVPDRRQIGSPGALLMVSRNDRRSD